MITVNVFAGEGDPKVYPDKFCYKIKDGIICVVNEGSVIAYDVKLANGTIVKANGMLINKDGSTSALKEGECIDNDGKISQENPEKKKNGKTDK